MFCLFLSLYLCYSCTCPVSLLGRSNQELMGLFLYIKSRLSIPTFVSIKQTSLDLSVFTCSTTLISVTTIASRLAGCTTLWSIFTFTCSWTSNDRLQGCKFDMIIISQGMTLLLIVLCSRLLVHRVESGFWYSYISDCCWLAIELHV